MNPMLIGAGIQAIGGLFGGRSRKKAAKKAAAQYEQAANQAITQMDAAVAQIDVDQARALELRAEDEARLKAATGYDLVKLASDAQAAGFNPLTVLNATGGAGYDGRGAVMTSPFMGRAGAMMERANGFMQKASGVMGTGQAVASTAGYFGDALSGLGRGLFDIGAIGVQQNHEMAMLKASMYGGTQPSRAAGGTPFAPRKGGSAPLVDARVITASPVNATRLSYGGRQLPVNLGTSDAELFATRYGDSELFSTGAGLSVLAADLWGTQTAKSIHQPIGWAAQWVDRNGQAWSRVTDRAIANAWSNLRRPRPAGQSNPMTGFQDAYQ